MLLNQKSVPEGRFFFTSATSGNHIICFQPAATSWYNSQRARLSFEFLIGQEGNHVITSPAEARLSGPIWSNV